MPARLSLVSFDHTEQIRWIRASPVVAFDHGDRSRPGQWLFGRSVRSRRTLVPEGPCWYRICSTTPNVAETDSRGLPRVGRRPVKWTIRRREPVREGSRAPFVGPRPTQGLEGAPLARFGLESPSGGQRVATACCRVDHGFVRWPCSIPTSPVFRPVPLTARPRGITNTAGTDFSARIRGPRGNGRQARPNTRLRCLGGFRHDTCRKPLPCVRLMRT